MRSIFQDSICQAILKDIILEMNYMYSKLPPPSLKKKKKEKETYTLCKYHIIGWSSADAQKEQLS